MFIALFSFEFMCVFRSFCILCFFPGNKWSMERIRTKRLKIAQNERFKYKFPESNTTRSCLMTKVIFPLRGTSI